MKILSMRESILAITAIILMDVIHLNYSQRSKGSGGRNADPQKEKESRWRAEESPE